MTFTVQNTSGGTVTLAKGDKFSLHGENLYVTGLSAHAAGARRRHRIIGAAPVQLSSFDSLSSSLEPQYTGAVTVMAQVKTVKPNQYKAFGDQKDGDYGPDQPESRKILYVMEANTSADWPQVKIELQDAARGLMFPGMFTVELIPQTKASGNQSLGIPDTVTNGTPVDLEPVFVDLSDQVTVSESSQVTLGDALIKFPRHKATQAQLLGDSIISITPSGQSAIQYRVKNTQGIVQMQTHHWMVYLERIRS